MGTFSMSRLLPVGNVKAALAKVAMADFLGKELAKTALSTKLINRVFLRRD